MANVVRAALSRAVKAGSFGKGLGYEASKTSGGETLDPRTDIAASELDSALATVAEATAVVTSLVGADETTPPGEIYAVTGMSATSVIVSVLFLSTLAAVATVEVVSPALFTPGTDTLTSLTEVNRTNDQLIVTWLDV